MDPLDLIVPALALVGALLGGYLTQIVGGSVAERREDRRLLREARVALERWVATRTGPMGLAYPGITEADMAPIQKKSFEDFFSRHFQATFEAKAALGAVRRFDERIGRILDHDRWDLPIESVGELREALTQAERRAKLTKRETKALVVDGHSR
ncbi:hypothetical protein [Ornithinimicrobium sp. INDO-MA30-4]|uniref:hypothetical protein n=1 Tax=Ornithinimicrobium sp. INDO-MA30-4 TaxID=2908651 RepID=UPI001F187793|nr:hypothetical protein [Ornithinimicrobium sp. INDO-MA30-4]UJH69385.1 hypothetical protein L0A91_08045 [Ornithinimicrobium sp. INDO-MA30-4]